MPQYTGVSHRCTKCNRDVKPELDEVISYAGGPNGTTLQYDHADECPLDVARAMNRDHKATTFVGANR